MSPRPGPDEAGDGRLRALAIVPARLGSTRLPRKMLLRETGRYLFEHTVNNTARCATVGRVVLATDSDEILAAAHEVGVEALHLLGRTWRPGLACRPKGRIAVRGAALQPSAAFRAPNRATAPWSAATEGIARALPLGAR